MSSHRKGDLVKLLCDTMLWERSTIGIIVSSRDGVGVNQIYDILIHDSYGNLRTVALDSYWVTGIDS
jgi:hypothetical protein